MTDIRCQTEAMIVLDDIVDKKHPYRACDRMVDFRILARPMHARRSGQGRREIGAERGLRMQVLRFVEDRSDREMERFMKDNMPDRRFRRFAVNERTPDRSCFGAFRKRLGTEGLMNILDVMRAAMKEAGPIREISCSSMRASWNRSRRPGRAGPRYRRRLRRVRQPGSAGGDPGCGCPTWFEGGGARLPRPQAARLGRHAVRSCQPGRGDIRGSDRCGRTGLRPPVRGRGLRGQGLLRP